MAEQPSDNLAETVKVLAGEVSKQAIQISALRLRCEAVVRRVEQVAEFAARTNQDRQRIEQAGSAMRQQEQTIRELLADVQGLRDEAEIAALKQR